MADEVRAYQEAGPGDLEFKYKDMGDGTHALVQWVEGNLTVAADAPDAATTTSVPASTTDGIILAANAARKAVILFNASNKTLYVRFGAAATLSTYTLPVFSQSLVILPPGTYVGDLHGIWPSGASGALLVTEVT